MPLSALKEIWEKKLKIGRFRIVFCIFVRKKSIVLKAISEVRATFKGGFINDSGVLNRNFGMESKN